MSLETIIVLVFLAIIIVWFFYRQIYPDKSSSRAEAPEPKRIEPVDSPDSYLEYIAATKTRLAAEVDKAIKEEKEQLEKQYSDDIKLKQLKIRLSTFARQQELDKALIALWEGIKHYPAWSKRDDFYKWNKIQLEKVSEAKKDEHTGVSFIYNNVSYCLFEKQWSGMEGETYADLTLYENSEEVFSISCFYQDDEFSSHYGPLDVKAFKTKGAWATLLLNAYSRIQKERNTASESLKYHNADEIKQKFRQ